MTLLQASMRRRVLLGAAFACAIGARAGRATSDSLPLVVDAGWLRDNREQPGVQLVDVSDLGAFRDGHIAGAVHGWWQDTMELNYPVYGTLLNQLDDQRDRRAVLERLGIGAETRAIFTDDRAGFRAARMVWFLRFLGHHDAALLDGGLAAWRDLGGPVESGDAEPKPVTGAPIAPQKGWYLITSQLEETLADPAVQLVDIRTDAERHDTVDGTLPLGQIPGCTWLPWNIFVDDTTGRLAGAADSMAAIAGSGLVPDRPVVLYGQYGIDAALPWIAFQRAGFPNPVVYDRGWAEWGTRAGLPVDPLPTPQA